MTEELLMQMSKEDLDAYEQGVLTGDYSGMSVAGLDLMEKSLSGSAPAAAPEKPMADKILDTPLGLGLTVRDIADYTTAKQAGLIDALSMQNLDAKDLPVLGKAFEQAEKSRAGKYGKIIGQGETSLGFGGATGMGVSALTARAAPALATYLSGQGLMPALARSIQGAGTSAVQGGMRAPQEGETRLGNAASDGVTGLWTGAGLETLAGAAPWAMSRGAGWLGKLKKSERVAYEANPKEAERLSKMNVEAPDQLNRELQNELRGARIPGGRSDGAISGILDSVVEPARQAKLQTGAGKSVRVKVRDLVGADPEIESEVQRIIALGAPKSTKTIRVPVEAVGPESFGEATQRVASQQKPGLRQWTEAPEYTAPRTETPEASWLEMEKQAARAKEPRTAYGLARQEISGNGPDSIRAGTNLAPQKRVYREFPYRADDVPLQGGRPSGERMVSSMEFPPVGPAPRSNVQDVEIPINSTPENLSLTYAQADRLRGMAQKAAYTKRQKLPNPTASDPASEADEAVAMRLRSGMDGVSPEGAQYDDVIEEAMNHKRRAEELGGNLAAILNPAKTTSSSSARGIGSYLDRNVGTKFGEKTELLSSGMKLDPDQATSGWDEGRRTLAKILFATREGTRKSLQTNELKGAVGGALQQWKAR